MVESLPAQPAIVIHEIEEIDLRSVFVREDRTFTPWLSEPENLARLARSLGIEIELAATEVNSGTFRTDILATNLADGTTVVIEKSVRLLRSRSLRQGDDVPGGARCEDRGVDRRGLCRRTSRRAYLAQ